MAAQVMTPEEGRIVKAAAQALCGRGAHGLADEALALVEGFGIPDHLLAAPIATDWVEYNAGDNQGELRDEYKFTK